MQKFAVSVGKKQVSFSIPAGIESRVIRPKDLPVIEDVKNAIQQAIDQPIGRKRLLETVRPGDRVAIIVTDTTRKLPEDIIVPLLLDQLALAGVKMDNITIVNALGKHEANTVEELTEMLGAGVMKRVKVINHAPLDPTKLKSLGNSAYGFPIVINDLVLDADVKIATGIIEPHLFAGYSGGVKTLSVGVAGLETLAATHNYQMLEHPKTRLGIIKDNIFRQFLTEAARAVGIDFIVNVVQNGKKELLAVYAGHPIKAFEKGVEKAREVFEVAMEQEYDIVVSIPGYPKSINLYQATRAWNSVVFGARPVVKKGGTIIIPAPCEKGVGEKAFYQVLADAVTPQQVIKDAQKNGFMPGEHKAFLAAKVLNYCRVIMTDCRIAAEKLQEMHLEVEATLQEALDRVIAKEDNPSVLIMPDGTLTLPIFK